VLVKGEQLVALLAVHGLIKITPSSCFTKSVVARGSFLDYSASVFSKVCSELTLGML
jgi:hypothetical protein